MENKRKIIIIAVVTVLFVVAGIGFWYWQSEKAITTVPATNPSATSILPATNIATATTSVTQEASKNIGATIFEKTQDPLKTKIPETNPLKRVMINPF